MKRLFCMALLLVLMVVSMLLPGCGGYNAYLQKNLPEAGFDKLIIKSDYGPVLSVGVQAEGAVKSGDVIKIDKLTYDRTGNTTSTHIYIEGYIREIQEKEN